MKHMKHMFVSKMKHTTNGRMTAEAGDGPSTPAAPLFRPCFPGFPP